LIWTGTAVCIIEVGISLIRWIKLRKDPGGLMVLLALLYALMAAL